MSPAEAAARLYACALNPLAHSVDGLEAVSKIGQGIPGFVLERGELRSTCELIRDTFSEVTDPQSSQPIPRQ